MENFGCRAARADGEAVSAALGALGHATEQAEDAAVVIVNTCSVTAEADREARAYIRRSRRRNPDAKIVVTGCYAQRAPEELAALDGVAAVVGNSHKALLPRIAAEMMRKADGVQIARRLDEEDFVSVGSLLAGGAGRAPIWADDRFAHSFLEEAQVLPGEQTRPNLKIQEGCGNRCTFCVIPQTRGSSRSLPHAAVLRQVRGFVAVGGNELVLSGINLGRWGRDLAHETLAHPTLPQNTPKDAASVSTRPTLAGLVETILRETDLPRLRLSSIEPMDWTDELIGLLAEHGGRRICRHAHLPLQSGSDAVLRRMHRRYRPWHYAQKVAALVQAVGPELTLGADVMVGFPGETDAEFQETLDLIRALPFGYLHLFPFSPRPGTPGWALHEASPVPKAALEERMAALRTVGEEKMLAHRRGFIGRDLAAITLNTPEAMSSAGDTAALTENFIPANLRSHLAGGHLAANQLLEVRVTGVHSDGPLIGIASR